MVSTVFEVPAASSEEALAHFTRRLSFETDCWDVHHAISSGVADFVLIDVRSADAYAQGHIFDSVNIPHRAIIVERMSEYPLDTLFVVYCAGPHCNGANKGAVRLAQLGRPVKEMIGGISGWLDEGFQLVGTAAGCGSE